MTILVNGVEKELEAIGINSIEWTQDLLGDYNSLNYDEEQEAYTMSQEDFVWWEAVVDMLNEINELEQELDGDARTEYEAENFDYGDLDDECKARLEWLKNRMKNLETRYHEALTKIGDPLALLSLPEEVKENLKSTKDLELKTKMLETLAEVKNKKPNMERQTKADKTAELLNRLARQVQNLPQNPAARQIIYDAAVSRLQEAAENMEGEQAELVHFVAESPDLQILQERLAQIQKSVPGTPENGRLFVDMDGTLAVFKYVDTLETLYEEGYFLNLEPIWSVVEAIKIFMKENPDTEVYCLGAAFFDSRYALPEKNGWMDIYVPQIDEEHRIFLPCGENKMDYVPGGIRPSDHLLDDYTDNLIRWPAKGIKLLNGINHTKGTWKGNRLSYLKEPAELAACIAAIMKGKEIKQTLQTKEAPYKAAGQESPRL